MSSCIIGEGTSVKLADAFSGTGYVTDGQGNTVVWKPIAKDRTFHFNTTGSTTVDIEVSNGNPEDAGTVWEVLATATGTGSVGFASSAPWQYVRLNVTANTGNLTVRLGT